jgi:hypothetical protein
MSKRLRAAEEGAVPGDVEALFVAVRRRVQELYNGDWDMLTVDIVHQLITPKLGLDSPRALLTNFLVLNKSMYDSYMTYAYPAFMEELYDRHYRSPFPPHERYRTAVFIERLCARRYHGKQGTGARLRRANTQYSLMSFLLRTIAGLVLHRADVTWKKARAFLAGTNSILMNKPTDGILTNDFGPITTINLFGGGAPIRSSSGNYLLLPSVPSVALDDSLWFSVRAELSGGPLPPRIARWRDQAVLSQKPRDPATRILMHLDAEFALVAAGAALSVEWIDGPSLERSLYVMAKSILLDNKDMDDAFFEACLADSLLVPEGPDTKVVYYRGHV